MALVGDLSVVNKVLIERLNCQTCGSCLRAGKYRWYKCTGAANHQICQECKEQKTFEKCLCGEPLMKDHCAMTEEILKAVKIQFKCPNEIRGCQEILGEKAMIGHETECSFRLVPCLDVFCCQIPYFQLLQHLKEKHGVSKECAIGQVSHQRFKLMNWPPGGLEKLKKT